MSKRACYNRTEYGFAMVSVLLMILIFFMITVAISSIVVLQARSIYETTVTELSFYLADSGIRYATAGVMYSFFMTGPSHTNLPPDKIIIKDISFGSNSVYKGVYVVEMYATEVLSPAVSGYTHSNMIACNARIYRVDSTNVLVAQRVIFADIYLGDTAGAADPAPGIVKATLVKYYERNR
ncbi:MAG: hypothetical protein AB2L14_33480 [Candidatus Xenobiia bacterium LiM19]